MRNFRFLLLPLLVIFVFISCAYADTGTESTTDDGFQCTTGNKYSGYFCKAKSGEEKFCTVCNVCGDKYHIPDDGEECDHHQQNHPEAKCNYECKLTYCGDEIKQTPNGRDDFNEECDNGNANSPTGTCDPDCELTYCGDEIVQTPSGRNNIVEECDLGANNSDQGTCNTGCQKTICGDDIMQRPNGDGFTEECDGNEYFPGFPDIKACRADCKVAYCGNEIQEDVGTEYAEECDYQDIAARVLAIDPTAECNTDSCQAIYCGNGIVERNEECDDGNRKNNDACTNACKIAVCRDGFTHQGVEECDDGNNNDKDACGNDCKKPVCGNGEKEHREECDDGNRNNKDNCSNSCKKCPPKANIPRCNYNNRYGVRCVGYNICGRCARYACNPRNDGCFPYDAEIGLVDGTSKLAGEVILGDILINPLNGQPAEVVSVQQGPEEQPYVELTYGKRSSKLTTKHIVLTGNGLKRAIDLEIGDVVFDSQRNPLPITSLRHVEVGDNERVINFILNNVETDDINQHFILSDGIITGDLLLQNKLKLDDQD